MEFGQGLLDIQELYDSIPWLPLAKAALRLNFPPIILYVDLLQCITVRTLSQEGAVCNPFEPCQSVIQGLRGGTRFAKILTHFIMRVVVTATPTMNHRVWIGDVCQKITGSRQAVRSNLILGIVKTGQELAKAGLRLAKKSVVMCTNAADARAVARAAKLKGFP
eukprot:5944921-Pyramimonas_sp.AAC.1